MCRCTVTGLLMVLLAAGCGGGGDDEKVDVATTGRYCDLSRQFNVTASNTGAFSSPAKLDGAPEAVARFEAQMRPVLDEFESAAPEEVRSDVEVVVDALGDAKSGDTQAVTSERVSAAIKKIMAFEEASCPVAATSGEG